MIQTPDERAPLDFVPERPERDTAQEDALAMAEGNHWGYDGCNTRSLLGDF